MSKTMIWHGDVILSWRRYKDITVQIPNQSLTVDTLDIGGISGTMAAVKSQNSNSLVTINFPTQQAANCTEIFISMELISKTSVQTILQKMRFYQT